MDVVRLDLHTLYYKEPTEQLTLVRGGVLAHYSLRCILNVTACLSPTSKLATEAKESTVL